MNTEKKIKIIPTAMSKSYSAFIDNIESVAHHVDAIQIDVMDGKFVPSKSWPYNSMDNPEGDNWQAWQNILNQDEGLPHWDKIDYEVHMMVEDQISCAKDWISAGVMRVIGHVEALEKGDAETVEKNRADFLALKSEFDVELGLSILPDTPNSALDPYLDHLDSVQFMGIHKVGFQGQEFEPAILDKITQLREARPDLPISVDGGVSFKTAQDLVDAGATILASGSVIFGAENIGKAIRDLSDLVNTE
jgi:ribulose-phosphate 3-epimerase